jgi:hypothetical protein
MLTEGIIRTVGLEKDRRGLIEAGHENRTEVANVDYLGLGSFGQSVYLTIRNPPRLHPLKPNGIIN